MKEIFHVHTYRCKHAGDEREIEYVKKAIELGVDRITFTDHAPFPHNPFGSRMQMEELSDYINTLTELKKKYTGQIEIIIGLETEFFPKYVDYYKELKDNPNIDLLLLGQHMYATGDSGYSFSLPYEQLVKEEYKGLSMAIQLGMSSGYFDAVAHPDRIFRKRRVWDEEMTKYALGIIDAAIEKNIPLEINESSKSEEYHYWLQFWKLAKERGAMIIRGLDAHSVAELKLITEEAE